MFSSDVGQNCKYIIKITINLVFQNTSNDCYSTRQIFNTDYSIELTKITKTSLSLIKHDTRT